MLGTRRLRATGMHRTDAPFSTSSSRAITGPLRLPYRSKLKFGDLQRRLCRFSVERYYVLGSRALLGRVSQ